MSGNEVDMIMGVFVNRKVDHLIAEKLTFVPPGPET
jgi:hypothetical protein